MTTRKIISAASAASLLAFAGLAMGANSTGGTIDATVTIQAQCHISSVSSVSFGTVDPTLAAPASGNGSFDVTCTKGTSLTDIKLDGGLNYAGGIRQMTDGTNFVAYTLYTDAGHTTPWGDGTSGGNAVSTGLPSFSSAIVPNTVQVYGGVTATAENVPAATYTDTVNITVDF